MTPDQRSKVITERLQKRFSPTRLEIIDDSAKHIGHAGSRDGAGHYTVIISADCFGGKGRVAIHRDIYQELQDLIPGEVHALQIKVVA